jgi:hypothetical protein
MTQVGPKNATKPLEGQTYTNETRHNNGDANAVYIIFLLSASVSLERAQPIRDTMHRIQVHA